MNRIRKSTRIAVLALLGLLLLAFVSAFVVIRSGWFRAKVRQQIVRQVEEATGGHVEIGSFLFDWRTLRAEVQPFVLHGKEGPGEPPLFRAKSVQVGLKIVSVLRRDVDIALLRLEEPQVRIEEYADGSTNLPQPGIARGARGNPAKRMLALAIGEFTIEEGFFELNSRKIPLNLRGENLKARLSYETDGPRYAGHISFRQLRVWTPLNLPVAFDADASIAVTADAVEISRARFETGRSSIKAAGAVKNLLSPRAEFEFEANLSLNELGKPLRLPIAHRGKLILTGRTWFAGASDYRITGRASGEGLAFERYGAFVENIRLDSNFAMSPGIASFPAIRLSGLGGRFNGTATLENFRRFRVEGGLEDVSFNALSRLPKLGLPGWSGRISGPAEIRGELAATGLRSVRANARLVIAAETGDLPVQGSVNLNYDQASSTVELGSSYLATPSSQVIFEGTLGRSLRVSLESTDLNDFLPVAASLSGTQQRSLPVSLGGGGQVMFKGLVTGKLEDPRLAGRVTVTNLVLKGRHFDRLTADFTLSQDKALARSLRLEQGSMSLQAEGQLGLYHWKLTDASALSGAVSVRDATVERLLADVGRKLPFSGSVSGAVELSGAVSAPDISGKFMVLRPVLYGERFDRARVEIHHAGGSLEVRSAQFEKGSTVILAKGVFNHPKSNWQEGDVHFEVAGKEISLSSLSHIPRAFDGKMDIELRGEAMVASTLRLVDLGGRMAVRDISLYGKPAGTLEWTAETKSGSLTLQSSGEIAGAHVSGRSTWRLAGSYPGEGSIHFTRLALSSLRPWWGPSANGSQFPVEGFADGEITFSGEAVNPDSWRARVELPVLELAPEERTAEEEVFRLRNDGPVVAGVDRKVVRIERARLVGQDTNLTASGTIAFQENDPLQLRLQGGVNLAALHNLDPDLTASGNSTVDATIRGSIAKPEIFGRLEFNQASFYLSDVPNGIDKASGTILFSRDRATIEKITAETGGGKLNVSGFVGFGGEQLVYRLQADASQVRVRYPEGVSTTFDGSLRLTGTARNSMLSGSIVILRSGVSPRVDLAAVLARSTKPLVTPSTENELLRGMLFDVRVQTSPNARFETALTRNIQAEADLRLRGTPSKPALLGHLSITQGEISFLGTRYTINRGDISFLNPVKLEPVLNLDLGTRVMGTDVNITFAGPLDKLNVTYRSDPPLQPNEIIALLAVGRVPSTDPTLTARQAELDQATLGQIGATTLIGQALASPVTGRLQRFFGVSRIRIDPRLTGVENNPQTQLTLEQQVSRDVTFTYITNLSRGQEQVVRAEWNVNKQWSILAVRDENGLFGIDVLFRKQFK